MAYQSVFKRYELKYLLTSEQKERLLRVMSEHMSIDKYGRTTIRNIYFDTADYRLIRRSIEKPSYKEKLRIRSYCKASADSDVFVELKKKYNKVVYKRRLSLCESEALRWVCEGSYHPPRTQISDEIDYFFRYYGELRPTVFLSYQREAYYSLDKSDFRVTFDDTILCRTTDISLCSEAYGTPILESGKVLMEIKCSGGIPLWMAHALSAEKIYKTSFSKYGTAYATLIFPYQKSENIKEQAYVYPDTF